MIDLVVRLTADAHRTLGRIQVHQKFRTLARELGLPSDCSLPTEAPSRLPRWYVDPEAFREERRQADARRMSTQLRYLFSTPTVAQHPLAWDPQYITID